MMRRGPRGIVAALAAAVLLVFSSLCPDVGGIQLRTKNEHEVDPVVSPEELKQQQQIWLTSHLPDKFQITEKGFAPQDGLNLAWDWKKRAFRNARQDCDQPKLTNPPA